MPSPLKMPKRNVIRPQDVVNMMGVKLRTAYRIMDRVRIANGKPKHSYITVEEFSLYTKIRIETILSYFVD